jgi:hypothetical protein
MYLFFIRHFNDVDHLTPVVWKMKADNYPVAVYCMNPRYDYLNDYRLNFLRDLGITVDYPNSQSNRHRGGLHRILNNLVQKWYGCQRRFDAEKCDKPFHKKILVHFAGKAGSLAYKLTRFGFYNSRWAYSFLGKAGAQAICFDHIMPSLYVVGSLLKAAKKMSIPSFALPHGVLLYTNEVTKPKATDERRLAKFNEFDYIIVPNRLRKDLLVRSGVSSEKISVLGSARYSHEWLEQNKRIIPRSIGLDKQDQSTLKVVFMPSKPQAQVDLKRLKATCDILAAMTQIDIRVKPHTRAGGEKHLFEGNSLSDASHILTAELCEWADVALVVGSSVITEALMRKKPALYLKYLHANTTLFEELGACWTINDENELKSALKSLQKNKADIPYQEAGVANFIKEVVYGGRADKDVLGNYENYIVSHSKQ